jgi:hypothetical protein
MVEVARAPSIRCHKLSPRDNAAKRLSSVLLPDSPQALGCGSEHRSLSVIQLIRSSLQLDHQMRMKSGLKLVCVRHEPLVLDNY